MPAAEPVLRLLNVPENLLETSAVYMKLACGGTVAVAAYNWINSVMRAIGDSKTPLIFLGVATVINVLLDLFFVMVLQTGVEGAALATVLAQGFSALSCPCRASDSVNVVFCFVRKVVVYNHGKVVYVNSPGSNVRRNKASYPSCLKTVHDFQTAGLGQIPDYKFIFYSVKLKPF